MPDIQNIFDQYKCCIIIPTYNNDKTLAKVIEDVLSYTARVIVINDGSTDNTDLILKGFKDISVLSNDHNRGKGYSLQKAFAFALTKGYDYALTMDSDGQHLSEDIPVFLDQLAKEPDSLIIGARNMDVENVPLKSSVGKKFSNFWITVTTGLHLTDTQSGFRLYPIRKLEGTKYLSSRFEFEVEVIVKAVWRDIKVISAPIHVFYPSKEERVSHYRPFIDFMRISMLNVLLVTLSLFVFWPKQAIRKYRSVNFKQLFIDEIYRSTDSNLKLALSIGFGIFMGIVPIWGYQLLAGFSLAHLFKLNKALFFIAANISLPPLIPFIIYASFYTGGLLLNTHIELSMSNMTMATAFTYLNQYILGSIILALIAGTCASIISYLTLALVHKAKN